jgi:thioredoxin reductase (NADPH)
MQSHHSSQATIGAEHPLAAAIAERSVLVVGFCAAWCNTCGDFSSQFESLAKSREEATFVWLDIEDDAAVAGEIDIENFPTIAIFHDRRLIHFGTTLPQSPIVRRLLDSLNAESKTIVADASLVSLPERLAAMPAETAARALRNR